MQKGRFVVLAILLAAPTLFLLGVGGYFMWLEGWWTWAWMPMTACMAAAYIMAWRWQRQNRLLRIDYSVPLYWTERDKDAWRLVEARARAATQLDAEKLSSVTFYSETAQEMALELARFYHPKAQDPLGSLTIPEILAVVELAAHDLAQMVNQYVPAGHLLTVNNFRQAKQAADWYRTASDIYWLVSGLFAPVQTGMRFLASQVGIAMPWQRLQQNLLAWFYQAFVHRMGTYLIDLHSGRLRVGAERYRQLMEQARPPSETAQGEGDGPVQKIILVFLGQSKVGKSSLINALLSEQLAQTDVVRTTESITRFELQPPGIPNSLRLTDTVGYGHSGPKEDQLKTTFEVCRQADLVLLVLHAHNPARQGDLQVIDELTRIFQSHPDLKQPPILGVLTHIDLLSPKLEWQPPYDWQNPKKIKEEQIDQAVAAVREQFGPRLAGVVPVCSAAEKIYGVQEWLLPTLAELLDQARAVGLLRCLKAESDAGKIGKIFQQLLASSKQAFKILSRG